MIARVTRQPLPPRRPPLPRHRGGKPRQRPSAALGGDVALAYSDGYVAVEISAAALDAYVEHTGEVPLPVHDDEDTGDRRLFDPRNGVRVVYDADHNLREVAMRGSDGLFVRINFTDDAGTDLGA